MSNEQTLLTAIAYARSGAVELAWRLLRESGLDKATDNSAALSVVGRLLKDRAMISVGQEQSNYYRQSASAYRRAASISGATYPLINAASLSLLAGDKDGAAALAREVLSLNQNGLDQEETPYYRIATRAEALLLLGRLGEAKLVLRDAIAAAPKAYEDHAATLRQFSLILDCLAEDSSWLTPLRPPRAFHFAGHMGVGANDEAVAEKIRNVLTQERAGFGFGALAAGADILIAEALVELGAELHLVLPVPPERFAEASVTPLGDLWRQRFNSLIDAAESVSIVNTDPLPGADCVFQLAAEVAMGRAAMHAQALCTEAAQLIVLDSSAPSTAELGSSIWAANVWKLAGYRQFSLTVPRVDRTARHVPDALPCADCSCLAAMLHVEHRLADSIKFGREVLPAFGAIVARSKYNVLSARSTANGLSIAFCDPLDAAFAALTFLAVIEGNVDVSIGGHYGVFGEVDDPFSNQPLLTGSAALLARDVMNSTPAGAFHVTEEFAAALQLRTAGGNIRTEFIGELPVTGGSALLRLFSARYRKMPLK